MGVLRHAHFFVDYGYFGAYSFEIYRNIFGYYAQSGYKMLLFCRI